MPTGKLRERFAALAAEFFEREMMGKIIGFGESAAAHRADVRADKQKRGLAMPAQDAQIAAIARSLNAVVATRDVKDFAGCGLTVVNSWDV